MSNTWKRIICGSLCLVMAVMLLPAVALAATESHTFPDGGLVLIEDDFSNYTNVTDVLSKYPSAQDNNKVYALSDGALVVGASNVTTNQNITISADVDIPMSLNSMTFYLKYEVVLSAPENSADTTQQRKYLFDINGCLDRSGYPVNASSTGPKNANSINGDLYKNISAAANGYTNGFATLVQYWKVQSSDIGTLTARLGIAKDSGTGYVSIKSFKITLLPAAGTYTGTDLITAMAYEDVCAQLTSNTTVEGNLTLGKNAVLDLNGYALSVSGVVNASKNAGIIDGSSAKTGELKSQKEALTFDAGAENAGQLPLWTGDGFIFIEPKLNEENVTRAFFVDNSVSADGFTLDFRPGFGEAASTNIRENYLSQGTCGITMNALLSWTDIYGASDSAALTCDTMFEEMYKKETARGRLKLTGAEQYKTISLAITLSSCGVAKTFELPEFSNEERMVVHFAGNYNDTDGGTLTLEPGSGSLIALENHITTGTGTLVLDFDVKTANGGDDYFAVRLVDCNSLATSSKTGYFSLFGTNGLTGANITSGYTNYFYKNTGNITKAGADYINLRIEIDLFSGAWTAYSAGSILASGTYSNVSAVLNGINQMVIRAETNTNGSTHYFDNVLLYTIK